MKEYLAFKFEIFDYKIRFDTSRVVNLGIPFQHLQNCTSEDDQNFYPLHKKILGFDATIRFLNPIHFAILILSDFHPVQLLFSAYVFRLCLWHLSSNVLALGGY